MANEDEHEAAEALFSAYVDGELAGKEREALEEHLTGCERCRGELESFKKTLAAVHDAPPIAPPDEFMESLKAQIHTRSRGRFFGARRERYTLEIASLVMLVVAVAVYVALSMANPSWFIR